MIGYHAGDMNVLMVVDTIDIAYAGILPHCSVFCSDRDAIPSIAGYVKLVSVRAGQVGQAGFVDYQAVVAGAGQVKFFDIGYCAEAELAKV